MLPRRALLLAAITLAACGFEPVYKITDTQTAVSVFDIAVTGAGGGHALERILRQRLNIAKTAPMGVSVTLGVQVDEMQKGSDGVARRLRLTHSAQLRLTERQSGARTTQAFSVSQFMTRGDSGADELVRRRALADLAMQNLADQILRALAATHRAVGPPVGRAGAP